MDVQITTARLSTLRSRFQYLPVLHLLGLHGSLTMFDHNEEIWWPCKSDHLIERCRAAHEEVIGRIAAIGIFSSSHEGHSNDTMDQVEKIDHWKDKSTYV